MAEAVGNTAVADPTLAPDEQSEGIKRRLQMALLTGGGLDTNAESTRPTTAPQASTAAQTATSPSAAMGDTLQNLKSPAVNTTDPNVTLAHASIEDQPAHAGVLKAQAALDKYNAQPGWKRAIVPGLIGLTSALAAHSRNGLQVQEMGNQDLQQLMKNREGYRQSLVDQLQKQQGLETTQYDVDQRNRTQDLLAAQNNQNRLLMSKILAGSRENVAETQAGAREYGADKGLEGRQYGADMGYAGRVYTADQGLEGKKIEAKARLEAARINANAALQRFLAGEARTDARQQAGFAHTDLKPTADEDRRADLTEAMLGYATELEDIVQRRPELFGPLAGRITQGRQLLGSDDEDVTKLKFLREQLGITQMGAHSFRAASAIAPVADALVNGFHTGPEALMSAIEMAKRTASTAFQGPQQRPTAFYPGGQSTDINPNGRPTSLTSRVRTGGGGNVNINTNVNQPTNPAATQVKPTGRTAPSAAASQPGDMYMGRMYLGGPKNQQSSWGPRATPAPTGQ